MASTAGRPSGGIRAFVEFIAMEIMNDRDPRYANYLAMLAAIIKICYIKNDCPCICVTQTPAQFQTCYDENTAQAAQQYMTTEITANVF